jgi:hypothetical protein
MEVNLVLKVSNAEEYSVYADLNLSVYEFKILTSARIGFQASQQQLIYRGKILKDDKTLSQYGTIY